MSHRTSHRLISVAGTSVIGMMLLAGPVTASQAVPSDGGSSGDTARSAQMRTTLDDLRSQHGVVRPAFPPAALIEDESSAPFVQIGIGAVGAAALIGSAAARRRHQTAAHPA